MGCLLNSSDGSDLIDDNLDSSEINRAMDPMVDIREFFSININV